jgi:hypothetical protein
MLTLATSVHLQYPYDGIISKNVIQFYGIDVTKTLCQEKLNLTAIVIILSPVVV